MELKLNDFDVLTFDCYGTLIDWESGIHVALTPLLMRCGLMLTRDAMLEAFARLESRQQAETPDMAYSDLLAEVHEQLAAEWGVTRDTAEDAAFGASVKDWPPFPDTVAALRALKPHFRLVILSNVDRVSFQATQQRLEVAFDAIYTAQDIGSYKPDQRNFTYLIDRLTQQGFAKARILHVAQSLFHDHVPAQAVGLTSVWIDRRHGVGGSGATVAVDSDARYDARFISLAALVDAHRAAMNGT
jgi:2-haloalkanoic acid dehalogenase type II